MVAGSSSISLNRIIGAQHGCSRILLIISTPQFFIYSGLREAGQYGYFATDVIANINIGKFVYLK